MRKYVVYTIEKGKPKYFVSIAPDGAKWSFDVTEAARMTAGEAEAYRSFGWFWKLEP